LFSEGGTGLPYLKRKQEKSVVSTLFCQQSTMTFNDHFQRKSDLRLLPHGVFAVHFCTYSLASYQVQYGAVAVFGRHASIFRRKLKQHLLPPLILSVALIIDHRFLFLLSSHFTLYTSHRRFHNPKHQPFSLKLTRDTSLNRR
jgi:hypothetical protein